MKVYCKDCKYFLKRYYLPNTCMWPTQWLDLVKEEGECKNYKRKWWKIWIKDKEKWSSLKWFIEIQNMLKENKE